MMSDKNNISPERLEEIVREEVAKLLREQKEQQQLDEVQLPGLGVVLNTYRVSNEAFKILSQAKFVPPTARKYLAKMAEANQVMVEAVDQFEKENPKLYKAVMGAVFAVDIGGSLMSKGKEYFLKMVYKVLKKRGHLVDMGGAPQLTGPTDDMAQANKDLDDLESRLQQRFSQMKPRKK